MIGLLAGGLSRSAFPRLVVVAAIGVAAVLASCSVLDSSESGKVTGEAEPPVLILENQTGHTAHYLAIEEGTAARMDLKLSDYRDWPTIGPGQTKEVPFDDIAFYEEGDPSVWVRWETGDQGGSFREPLR